MSEPGRFEFDTAQNEVFRKLARGMRIVGAFLLTLGVLYVVAFLLAVNDAVQDSSLWDIAINIGTAMLLASLLGVWTQRAGKAFGKIAETTGNDIEHLMHAADDLRKMYTVLSAVVILILALVVLSIVLSLVQ